MCTPQTMAITVLSVLLGVSLYLLVKTTKNYKKMREQLDDLEELGRKTDADIQNNIRKVTDTIHDITNKD